MTLPIDPHAWFLENLDAYVAGGLSPEDREAIESHAVICAACAVALQTAQRTDADLRHLFAPVAPSPHFEENLIMTLRAAPAPRLLIHPAVVRSAAGVAAVLMLGGFGLIGNHAMKDGKFPRLSLPDISFPKFAWFGGDRVQVGQAATSVNRELRAGYQTHEIRDLLVDIPDFDASPDLSRLKGSDREHTVTDLIKSSQYLIRTAKFEAAQGILSQILSLDPENDYARGVKPLVDDRAVLQQKRNYREQFDLQLERSPTSADEKRIPYDNILRYPPSWPDLGNLAKTESEVTRSTQLGRSTHYFNEQNKWGEKNLYAALPEGSKRGESRAGETNGRAADSYGLQLPETLAQNVEAKFKPALQPAKPQALGYGEQLGEYYAKAPADTNQLWSLSTVAAGSTTPKPAQGNNTLNVVNGVTSLGTVVLTDGDVRSKSSHGSANNNDDLRVIVTDSIAPAGGRETTFARSPAAALPSLQTADETAPKGAKPESPNALDYFYSYHDGATPTKAPPTEYFKPVAGKPTILAAGITAETGQSLGLPSEKPIELRREVKEVAKGKSNLAFTAEDKAPDVLARNLNRTQLALGDTEIPANAPPPNAPKPDAATPPPANPQVAPLQQTQRKIIRNGQMEFEVDSFDSSFMQLKAIVAEEGGYVASTDSEKLSNGKVKGTVTLRVPPDRLDVLVLKLRGMGDLKNQKIAAQDISKQYTDLASGLRAARVMEERLLDIIKNGKGEVKDLVEAEKQLGTYRERIEQIEGELRYYDNLVSLSTLNITLFERDIKAPTAAFETETVQAGLEVEDVEKARADALKAIDDAKGRVIESSLKKLDAGQLTASIVAEVTPEAAGPLTDRLKQLGRVARLEADRKQTTTGGTGAPTGLKMERKATRFNISLYNLANIAPRETVNITLAADDVEKAYKAILNAMRGEIGAAKANTGDITPIGRVVSSNLTRPKPDQTSGALSLEVRAEQSAALEAEIRLLGEVMNMTITENPDANNVTRAKRGYSLTLVSIAQVAPRETQTLQVAAKSVPDTYQKLLNALQDPKTPSRILSSQLNEQDRQNITAQVDVEVPRSAVGSVESVLAGIDSDVYSRNASRANDTQNTLDTKVRLTITMLAADRLQPRETTSIALEVSDVETNLRDAISTAETAGGKVVERQMSKQQNGRIVAHAVVDVPLTAAPATLDKLRNLGTVRVVESTKNQQVPDGPLARARFDLTLGNAAPLVSSEDSVGSRLSQGLRTSLNGLTFSLMLIVIGICLIGPFALLGWAGWKFFRRGKKKGIVVSPA